MRCKLCQQERELRDSHAIPEFLYTALYDEEHKYYVVSNVNGKSARPLQKGLRERLHCADCETKFSRWETYAANVLYNKNRARSQKIDGTIVVDGLDYAQFKLFLLSLIWRAGVSSLQVFEQTQLGQHEERLRQMLFAADPGAFDRYGCLVFAVTIDGRPLDGTIYGPQPCSIDAHRCYRLLVRAFLFIYFISSHRPDDVTVSRFVREDGHLEIPVRRLQDMAFLDAMCREIVTASSVPST
jgi:hypothetical protein